MPDELDSVIFTCCKCGGQFDHTQGTWLPIAENSLEFIERVNNYTEISLTNLLREPEIVTSDDFTCYDCT